jgi:DNA-binding transcriptional LysR family regulator
MTAPISFGTRHLAPALVEFARHHPKVELDVSLDDKRVDLVGGGFDLGIRIGKLPDSSLRARRLTSVRASVLASPGYLAERGRPEHPRDLNGHDLLYYANLAMSEQFRFKIGNRVEQVSGTMRMRADSGDMLKAAACAGLGVVTLPNFIVSDAVRSGDLEVLLRDYPIPEVGMHAVMPPGRATTARVRALVDHLAAAFGPEPDWDPCNGADGGRHAGRAELRR